MAMLSMRMWGAPNLTKTALLIHGNRELGDAWWAVAEGLVKEGYTVHAPDMLNNGFSSATSPPHTMEDYIDFLSSSLPPTQYYHSICGVSLGGNVANGLFKLFADPKNGRRAPERMVLLEPGVEVKMPRVVVESINNSANVPKTEDQLREQNLDWTTTDVVLDRLGLVRTNKEAFQAMFSGDGPPFHSHDVLASPEESANSEVILLAGDPKKRAMYNCDTNLPILEKSKPHIKLGRVAGAAHLIHKDKPQAVVDALVGRFAQSSDIEVIKG